ncbi:MAG: nucleotide exchange factor GrpE [Gemmatimonadota bacterium]|nr:nucleotide exchange factor GrpE [Gemmatimonadota bacterium]
MTETEQEMIDTDDAGDVDGPDVDDSEAAESGTDEADDIAADAPSDGNAGEDTPGHVDEVGAPPEEELDAAQELEVMRDRHLRLAAEFDNYRRRTRKELLTAGDVSRADLAGRLLEIIDDLTRVAEAPCDPEQHQAMHDGVGLIARKLVKTLSDVGMEPVNPLGERFDPNYHEALILTPTDDPESDELVSQVLLVGYRLGDRLLRAAQVAVFRHEDGE